MRKAFLAGIIFIIFLTGCTVIPANTQGVTISTQEETTVIPLTENQQQPVAKTLPVYVPGSIKLESEEDIVGDFDIVLPMRRAYYKIPGAISGLRSDEEVWNFYEDPMIDKSGMILVALVKYFNISKEEFLEALKEDEIRLQNDGYSIIPEDAELPNADIIYTFDNDIINEYYRRE